jgi:hypothetical protein
MAARPGIKTSRLSTLTDPLPEGANTSPELMPLVQLPPGHQVRRKGLKLALRRLAYWVLAKT